MFVLCPVPVIQLLACYEQGPSICTACVVLKQAAGDGQVWGGNFTSSPVPTSANQSVGGLSWHMMTYQKNTASGSNTGSTPVQQTKVRWTLLVT